LELVQSVQNADGSDMIGRELELMQDRCTVP